MSILPTFLKRFFIKIFLIEYKGYLINKTDFYDDYFLESNNEINHKDNKLIDSDTIILNNRKIDILTSKEIDKLYDIIQTEKTYMFNKIFKFKD